MLDLKFEGLYAQANATFANNEDRRSAATAQLNSIYGALIDYGNQSTPSSQFLKTLMCKLPASQFPGGQTSPFWSTTPDKACM